MYINEWVKIAEKYVPSRKDRAVIREELMDHYTDRYDALRSTGLSFKEASKRALAAMGDPDDTGRLLRMVHKPWLTWALRLTRIGLILLILIALGFFGTFWKAAEARLANRQLRDPGYIHPGFTARYSDRTDAAASAVSYGTVKGRGWFGSSSLTLTDAWFRWERYKNKDGSQYYPTGCVMYDTTCLLFLEAKVPFWIDPDLRTIEKHTTVTNDRGESLSFSCSKGLQTAASCTFYLEVFQAEPEDTLQLRCDTGKIFFEYEVRFAGREDLDGWFTQPAPEDEAALLKAIGPPKNDDYQYGIGVAHTVVEERSCVAVPVSAGTLELSVPWTVVQLVEHRPKGSSTGLSHTVDFVLRIDGPWQDLFLTEFELLDHLSMTDDGGNTFYLLMEHNYAIDPATVYADRGYYRLKGRTSDVPNLSAWYELTLDLEDGPVTLRLTPTEGG